MGVKMRAMMVKKLGDPLVLSEIPCPTLGPGEVLLQIKATGLNFADTLLMTGKYQEKPALPFTPGLEICGIVTAHGPDVTAPAIGTRVAAYGIGGLADYAVHKAADCVPVPAQMSAAEAAGFLVAYGTGYLALKTKARLAANERLLVLGAAGGVGLTAVEIGKRLGAEVIAFVRGADKLDLVRAAGADHVFDSDTVEIRETVKALGGADVVYDPVGGDQFRAAMRATNMNGRLIPIGFASGDIPQIPANIVMVKNLDVIGFCWGGFAKARPDLVTAAIAALFQWFEDGTLKPHISKVLPLEQANEGLELLRTRQATGKVIITP